ncbi:MAG: hypothetical protein HC914_13245 [Chloroflexaceae bacterium]|nr:hypothetical protein [Chloroflexaceae bacterium]
MDGNWEATNVLTQPLQVGQGIRTTSTTGQDDTIEGYNAGTTSKLSDDLYGSDGVITPTPLDPPLPVQPPLPFPRPEPRPVPTLAQVLTGTTVITVNSTLDPNTSLSETCYTAYLGGQTVIEGECTLRRAIVEARSVPADQRPVLIRFAIPTSDLGYLGTAEGLEAWKITLDDSNSNQLRRVEGGSIYIDGTTQPDGRTDGPPIIIEGNNTQNILVIDNDNNVIRGLALQGFPLVINGNDNFVEENWLGLSNDGQTPYFINDDATRNNNASIEDAETPPNVREGIAGNVYRNNVVTGSDVKAMTIRSDKAWVVGNYIATRADGTVPAPPVPDERCSPLPDSGNWFGGEGIEVGGRGTQVGGPDEADRNYLAGLLIQTTDLATTQPVAIETNSGAAQDMLIMNNYIGRDTSGTDVGVCGAGITANANFTLFEDNLIIGSPVRGIFVQPNLIGGNSITYRSNQIIDSGDPIFFGPDVPDALKFFSPAKVLTIEGTTVTGTNGDPVLPPGGRFPEDLVIADCPTARLKCSLMIVMRLPKHGNHLASPLPMLLVTGRLSYPPS